MGRSLCGVVKMASVIFLKPIFLGVFAASCGMYCSLGFKKHPDSIWISLQLSGLAAIPLFFAAPLSNGRPLSSLGRKRGATTTLALLVEVLAGYVHVITQYFVLRYLNLGDAMVLTNGLQLFGMIVGEFLILNKIPSAVSILASLLILFGVFLVAKPPIIYQYIDTNADDTTSNSYDLDYLLGTLLCALSSFCSNVYYIMVTKISHVTVSYHVASVGILFSIFCVLIHIQEYGFETLCGTVTKLFAVSFGIAQFLGHFSAVTSTRSSSPLFALIIRLTVIPIGYLYQVFYLKEPLQASSLIGGLIIVVSIFAQSCYTIVIEKRRARLA